MLLGFYLLDEILNDQELHLSIHTFLENIYLAQAF